MYELKPLAREAIPAALEKAHRYRMLNEPYQAESICLDILQVEPSNQEALIMLLLARTDKFKESIFPAYDKAMEVLEHLGSEYCKAYYRGIVFERRAKASMNQSVPSSGHMAYEWFKRAMADYERALERCSPGNQDAALRWNTCARILNDNPRLTPADPRSDVEVTDAYE